MSQTESHIGRLIPVKANEGESREDLMKKILLENGHPLSDPEGIFDKLREWFDECVNFKYLFHKGKYWDDLIAGRSVQGSLWEAINIVGNQLDNAISEGLLDDSD